MTSFIIAIDQGTTSTRAALFDETGKLAAMEQEEIAQHYPRDGWVEHDPLDIWTTVENTCKRLIQKPLKSGDNIKAVGITNQRETTVIWDRNTGEPIYPAIVWQDRRTAETCSELRTKGFEKEVMSKTGLLLDPYFSATKIAWILDNVDGARKRAKRGELAFGNIDSFLLWRLTNGQSHKTDVTNASRTMLYNIDEQCWDQELLKTFNIPLSLLPDVCDNNTYFGETTLLGAGIPIFGIAGDQQAALVGQCCFEPGSAKVTYGTGGFLMINTGNVIVQSQNRLLATVAYRINGKVTYAIEGSIFIAGAAVKWLVEKLGLFSSVKESETIARQADPDSRVVMVPAFTGLGAPHWSPNTRGAVLGMTRNTGVPELVAAALESIAFQTMDLIRCMKDDGAQIKELRVDGGMAANDWFLSALCNLIDLPVLRQSVIETTALGAGYLAGLGCGMFKSLDFLRDNWSLDRRFEPEPSKDKWQKKYDAWRECVLKVL